ncbi:MAG: helix-turn-helix transcriptional regulator [Acidobacteria bacterium]|nr:helix-turn-helix transcriptional regulator [Acidobacteriota bacterium]
MDFAGLQGRLLGEARRRIRAGELTERGLARAAGISQPHLHQALGGRRRLSIEYSDRLLRRLDLTVPELVAAEQPGPVVGYTELRYTERR